MPWTAKQFASRHNKKLNGPAAAKASRQANAMIRSGVDEGIAIATANKTGDRAMRHNPHSGTDHNEHGSHVRGSHAMPSNRHPGHNSDYVSGQPSASVDDGSGHDNHHTKPFRGFKK